MVILLKICYFYLESNISKKFSKICLILRNFNREFVSKTIIRSHLFIRRYMLISWLFSTLLAYFLNRKDRYTNILKSGIDFLLNSRTDLFRIDFSKKSLIKRDIFSIGSIKFYLFFFIYIIIFINFIYCA